MDWPVHKLLCEFAQDFTDEKRPDPDHIRAILFSDVESQPRLIWVPVQKRLDGIHAVSFAKEIIGDKIDIRLDPALKSSMVLNHSLDKIIHILMHRHDETLMPLVTYGKVNKSFLKIDKEFELFMKGPMVAYSGIENGPGSTTPTDLALGDLCHIVDLTRFVFDKDMDLALSLAPGEKIEGVRANCVGDRVVFDVPHLQEVRLPFGVFPPNINATVSATKKIRILLYISNLPHALSWRGRSFKGRPASADLVFVTLTSTAMLFGINDVQSDTAVRDRITGGGSLIVAREDRKPLKALHLEAMLVYLKEKLRVLIDD